MKKGTAPKKFDKKDYDEKIERIFNRFPSVQKTSFDKAYKPGLDHMLEFDSAMGFPSKSFRSIHVAGTNGKGSVASMMTAVLARCGMKTGLYTSPHIIDFRERSRIVNGDSFTLIPEEYVWDFLCRWEDTFERLDLSFFEITTGLAFKWFADEKVDVAVIETGLGGRLDSTNVITPDLSIITSIGMDHCSLLGDSLGKIAAEKAGIMKEGVPAIIGVTDPETAPVFLSRAKGFCPVTFADRSFPVSNPEIEAVFEGMDLKGEYQKTNLGTVFAAIEVLKREPFYGCLDDGGKVSAALKGTASITGFHGRWEKVSDDPYTIVDIGHNPPALEKNFSQLERYLENGDFPSLTIVYGVMADKDLDGIIPLMPRKASYIFVTPATKRALPSGNILQQFREWFVTHGLPAPEAIDAGTVEDGISIASERAGKHGRGSHGGLVYIGGSTFVVSEAISFFSKR